MGLHVVTGGAGFIGVNLIQRLLQAGQLVIALDNLSRGRQLYWNSFRAAPAFCSSVVDCSNIADFRAALHHCAAGRQVDEFWHLAANSDIPAGLADPNVDLRDTFLTTFNSIMLMRELRIPVIHFASSSAIYGDLGDIAISEDSGPLRPISNYGAMKLASEAQIYAAAEAFVERASVFRFPNIVGVPATHGVMLDFVRKLKSTPDVLEVLGDGSQMKAYLHVSDLVDAMVFIATTADKRVNVFNIGPADRGVTVREIAEMVRGKVSPSARIAYGEGNRGWVGDVPRFHYAVQRLATLGWSPKLDSRSAVKRAIDEIVGQEAGL